MVFLRKTLYVLIVLLLAPTVHAITVEQEQQFMYYWYAARQAITDERYQEAFTLLQFCNTIKPDDAKTLSFLGVIYESLHKEDIAKEFYKKAYEVDPANNWQNWLEPLKQDYIAQGEWKKALKVQDEIDARKGEMDAYSALTRYEIYARWGKTKQAIGAIDAYLKTDPDNLRFQLFRLECLERTKAKKKELYAQYERVLELDPYNAVVLNNYAYHLATHGGDLTKAEKMSSLAIREQPNNPVFLDTYGWILHLQGQDDLAKFYLQKALRNVEPEHSEEIQSHIDAIQ